MVALTRPLTPLPNSNRRAPRRPA